MSAIDEERIESDCFKKRDNVKDKKTEHRNPRPLVRNDSLFQFTSPNCGVLDHLFMPATMVALPGPFLPSSEEQVSAHDIYTSSMDQ